VVLPTFNRASLLPQSIESVLNQTENNLELIVVDDGSSDGTPEIVGRYAGKDRRITFLRQQNLGLPRALNNGFRLARGQFYTWTSDDNRYLPDAFAIMSRCLRDHPEVGLVCAKMLLRTKEGLVHFPMGAPEEFWRENTFGAAFMYRSSLAAEVGTYDPALTMVEDYDFFLRASYHLPVRHLPYIVYEFLDHGDSLSTARRPEQFMGLEQLLRRHMALGRAKRWQLSHLAATVSGAYRTSGKPKDAVRLALLSWRLWPLNWRSYRSIFWSLAVRIFRRNRRK
jgi:glycosyltransferase involved in cell wall biosynthesis